MLLEQGTIKLHDLSVQQGKQSKHPPLLTATTTEATGCSITLTAPGLTCTSLLLEQADFSTAAPSTLLFPEKEGPLLGLSVDAVKITNAKARLPLGSNNNLTLPLTDMDLEIQDLQAAPSEKDNLHLQAKVGADGQIKVEGYFRQAKGKLELTAEDLDITLLNQSFAQLFQKKLAPTLQQGRLSLQGQLELPVLDFQGDVQLNDLVTQNQHGTALRWKSAQGKQARIAMKPFFIHIEELDLEKPELKLASPKSTLPTALISLLRQQDKKPILPPFTIKQCRIQGANMPGTGSSLGFSAVHGSLAPLASGTPASFTFSGKVNKREFTAHGRLAQNHAEVDSFTVAELPLESAAKQFAEQLALTATGGIRWVPSAEQKNEGRVHFIGFLPQPDSEYALLLALLTDNKGTFSLPLSLPATASPSKISNATLKKLQRLHLQAVVSPQAVLEKELPDLTLPQRITCLVGDSLPDFMDDLENFTSLMTRRPHLALQLQGCYDDMTDRKYLLSLLQEEEDYRVDLENIRRQEEMARLIAEEELRQVELVNTDMPIGEDLIPQIEAREDLHPLPHQPVELPQEILPELARQRALVVQEYLVNTLNLPQKKITIAEPVPGGPWVDLLLKPIWQQPSGTTSTSAPEGKE
ncbi:MAG: DUF748 domain-containing protein [Candidatus Electrothrix sp. GW3-4]|uniref:DUF748 domain-containing protein n=1 Tax=Candidatus Electrothrix sp. GW3-4 TaxID=3126740 RepID=UPI0030CEC270